MFKKKANEYNSANRQGREVAGDTSSSSLLTKFKRFVSVALLCTFIFFAGRLFLHQQQQLNSLNDQKSELEENIRDIQDQTRNLQEEINRLNDKDYIEHVARNEYGMVGEDDIVFVPARGIGE